MNTLEPGAFYCMRTTAAEYLSTTWDTAKSTLRATPSTATQCIRWTWNTAKTPFTTFNRLFESATQTSDQIREQVRDVSIVATPLLGRATDLLENIQNQVLGPPQEPVAPADQPEPVLGPVPPPVPLMVSIQQTSNAARVLMQNIEAVVNAQLAGINEHSAEISERVERHGHRISAPLNRAGNALANLFQGALCLATVGTGFAIYHNAVERRGIPLDLDPWRPLQMKVGIGIALTGSALAIIKYIQKQFFTIPE